MAKRQTTNVHSNVLRQVQDTLLDSFKAGRRNYTIFSSLAKQQGHGL